MDESRAYLNDLAKRSFRDVADQDYIAARLCFRGGVMVQFLWMAHQSIEKYLKAILIFNGMSSKNLDHSLKRALSRVEKIDGLVLDLTDPVKKFIEYLDSQGPNRYLERAHFTMGMEILDIDRAVWEIRRYCQILNYDIKVEQGRRKNMMKVSIDTIHAWMNSERPHKFSIMGGHLEKVLKKKNPTHIQREHLVWQNFYYGARAKKRVRIPMRGHAINPTQVLHPELFAEFDKVVQFPKEVRDYYLKEWKPPEK